MSYGEDILRLDRLDRLRKAVILVAILLRVLHAAVDGAWILWVITLCWLAGTAALVEIARITKRLGRDTDRAWLYAAVAGVMTAWNLVDAVRA